jgi:hypothetical protein
MVKRYCVFLHAEAVFSQRSSSCFVWSIHSANFSHIASDEGLEISGNQCGVSMWYVSS